MKDQSKTKHTLIQELASLRQRIEELEKSEAERKRAEEALKESEEKYRSLIENIQDGIYILDSFGKFTFVNDVIVKRSGYPAEWFLDRSYFDIISEKDRELVQKYFNEVMDGKTQIFDLSYQVKSGNLLHLETHAAPIFEGAKVIGLLGVSRDITERKQFEEALQESEIRYRELFENMQSGVSVYETHNNGEDFIFKEYNASAEMLDNTPRGQAIGRSVVDVFPRVKDFGLFDVFQRVYRTGKPERHPVTFYKDERIRGWRENHVYKLPSGEIVSVFEDITKRKAAEEALKETNETLSTIIQSSPLAIITIDPDGNVTKWNPAAEQMFGWLESEVLGQFLPIVSEDKRNEHLKLRERVLRGEAFTNIEVRRRKKDGSSIDISISGAPLHDSQGRMAGIMSLSADITERKRTEEALRISQEKLREAHRLAHIGVWNWVAGTDTVLWTEELYSIAGLDPILPAPTYAEHSNIYAQESWDILKEAVERAMKTGETYQLELKLIRPDGTTRWVNAFGCATYDNHGRIEGLHGTVHDITERKQAEETLQKRESLLQKIFDVLPVGLWFADKDGKLLRGNPAGVKIWGAEPKIAPAKYGVFKARRLPSGEEIAPEDWALVHTVKERVTVVDEMLEIDAFDGKKKVILNYTAPVLDDQGAIQGAIVVNLDITERKQAEEELKTSRSQLRALSMRLQQIREEDRIAIAREIHDEMGGGLTGLKMDLSWLSRKIDDTDRGEERIALMNRIHASNVLIDQMIQVVRRVSTHLRPSVLDDLGLIAALEWQLSEFTSRTEIPHEFTTTFEYVNMEEDTAIAVFRIFQEALTNVARHSRATKVAVVLREGERSLFGDESFVLEIRDNGRGITQEEILNPGSLGLLGMKERVLAFSGEISIYGKPGGGTTLILKIPLIQGEPS